MSNLHSKWSPRENHHWVCKWNPSHCIYMSIENNLILIGSSWNLKVIYTYEHPSTYLHLSNPKILCPRFLSFDHIRGNWCIYHLKGHIIGHSMSHHHSSTKKLIIVLYLNVKPYWIKSPMGCKHIHHFNH